MKYKLWLANMKGVSARKIALIIEEMRSEELYYCKREALVKLSFLEEKDVDAIIQHRQKWNLEKELFEFIECQTNLITIEDERYPNKLKTIFDAPYGLFYKGTLPLDDTLSVSIVGARQRSAYGEHVAQELSKELGALGVQVISGMAMGIDADAHKGAMLSNGKTYAVLGCGVDVIYPKSNHYIYNKILDSGGGILSEFPVHTPAIKTNFPRRNRIISGLSDIVVVIEAKEKSGSLITAEFAMEQGKEVYALPGRIYDELSGGTNQLIHDGCGVIFSIDEFLKEIGFVRNKKLQNQNMPKNVLEKEERLLYSLIDFTPIGVGSLMEKSKLSFLETIHFLESLKGKGMIAEHPSNYFVRSKII